MTLLNKLISQWKIKCVIFDLDGTLVDTLDKHIEAFQILFSRISIFVPYEKIVENMGRTPKDTLLSLLPNLVNEKEKLTNLANEKEEILATLLDTITKFDGSDKVLNYIKQKNISLCLASSTPRSNVYKILRSTQLYDYFNEIITGEDISKGKPYPDIFIKAAQKAKIKIKNCLVIGDSPYDILAAKNAGMKIIAVTTGKHSYNELKSKAPTYLISHLEILLEKV